MKIVARTLSSRTIEDWQMCDGTSEGYRALKELFGTLIAECNLPTSMTPAGESLIVFDMEDLCPSCDTILELRRVQGQLRVFEVGQSRRPPEASYMELKSLRGLVEVEISGDGLSGTVKLTFAALIWLVVLYCHPMRGCNCASPLLRIID
ncbi:hypothetical protein M3J07_010643 [Ascochyta lentis]